MIKKFLKRVVRRKYISFGTVAIDCKTRFVCILLILYLLPYKYRYGDMRVKRGGPWIGTVEVNRDTRLDPGETQRQNVSPGSSPAQAQPKSQFTSTVPIHPV